MVVDSLDLRWSEGLNYGDAHVVWGVKCAGKTILALTDEQRWTKHPDYKWAISTLKPQIINAVEFVNLVYVDQKFEEALKLVGGTQRWSRAVKEKNMQLLQESEAAHRAHAKDKHQCDAFDVALLGKGSNLPGNNKLWADVVVGLVGCKNAVYEFKLRANGTSLDWDQVLKMLPVSE